MNVTTRTALWRTLPTLALVLAAAACGGSQGTQTAARTADGASDAGTSTEEESSGPSAPDFSLPTLNGGQISLSDYEGEKVVLLDFWSTTCDPCLREMPELVKIYNERKDKGFEILAISTDGPETASAIPSKVQSTGMNFPVLLDEETEVVDRYNPKGQMPFTVLVDRKGRIVLKRAGYMPGDRESMRTLIDAIDKALAQK